MFEFGPNLNSVNKFESFSTVGRD